METTARILIQARALKVGDELVNTPEKVVSAPTRGLRTPAGKVDLGIDGYLKTWNKNTEIAILID